MNLINAWNMEHIKLINALQAKSTYGEKKRESEREREMTSRGSIKCVN
jgi:Cft2 family RNA processing exonuclease